MDAEFGHRILFESRKDAFHMFTESKVNYVYKSSKVLVGMQEVEDDSFNDIDYLYGHLSWIIKRWWMFWQSRSSREIL